jgi:hypothetical protein
VVVQAGASHSAFFAHRHVDASDDRRYDVRVDATPGGTNVVNRFRVERRAHRNREHAMGLQGVASFQAPYPHTISAV